MKKPIFILSFITFSFGTTIHVPADVSTIQEGLNTAIEGDTVLVASGTYVENIVWPATNGIKLIGSGQDSCIIDGDSSGSVIYFYGVDSDGDGYFENVIDTTTTLNGFTIQNGYANTDSSRLGGGIFCEYAGPIIENVYIKNNFARGGGGVAIKNYSNVIIRNSIIANNTVWGWNDKFDGPTGNGGGIYANSESNLFLHQVEILNNTAPSGGGIFHFNNGLSIYSNVTIQNNEAINSSGGIYILYIDSLFIHDSDISNNTAGEIGGGAFLNWANPSFNHVTFKNNIASHKGAGLYLKNSFPIFSSNERSNIFSNTIGNQRGYGADLYSENSTVEVILDTFTISPPTDYYVSPVENFTFDILNTINDELINTDVYVSVEGSNSNDGLTPETAFKTISYAYSRLDADSLNPRTIFLGPGIYSSTTNGENSYERFFEYIHYVSMVCL